ncbi:MAG: TonB-dependent receptor, partial [Gammaproteobacteria bacterium]
VPEGLLDLDREAIFTAPDETENQLHQTILRGSYDVNDSVRVDGVGFYRRNRTRSFNGDGSEFEECVVDGLEVLIEGLEEDELDAAGLDCAAGITTAMLDAAGGEVAENVEGNPIAAEFDDPLTGEDHERDAINNISRRTQTSWGGDLQTTFDGELSGRDNRLVVGGGIFRGEADFDSDTEVSFLNPVTRSTNNSPDSGEFVEEARTRVNTETHTVSLYFTDTLSLTNAIAVTLAGRYNRTRIKIRDRSGDRPELNGNHTFSRFNPAVGLTWQARDQHNLYASYNESSRAPTPIELSCNDEIAELAELLSGDDDFECRLPNAFLADPPLDQVVAKTIEAGVRGELGAINYHVGLFRTEHHDDIIFQSTGRATGLFKNVDETRRQGMETRLSGRVGNLTWYGAYTFLKATYESDFEALSPNHAGADAEGLINVRAGDRLPGIPKHLFKLGGDYRHSDWALGAELLHNSSQFLRGDESNQLDRVDGHTVVNLRSSYRINKNISIRARVNNVFDTDYETFGIVGEDPDEVVGLGGIDDSPLFFGPAPGRAAFVTVKAEFD